MFNRLFKQMTSNKFVSSLLDPTMYSARTKPFFMKIEQHVLEGHSFKAMKPPKYVEAVASYKQASKLADELLEVEKNSLSPQHKVDLANVYAEYASAITKYRAFDLETAQVHVKKALELDEENVLGKALDFEMNFDPFEAVGKLD